MTNGTEIEIRTEDEESFNKILGACHGFCKIKIGNLEGVIKSAHLYAPFSAHITLEVTDKPKINIVKSRRGNPTK